MESFTQALAPQLLAIEREWANGWSSGWYNHHYSVEPPVAASYNVEGEQCKHVEEDYTICLPDELLEKIMAVLPISNIFRAGAVCKRWKAIITSSRFLRLCERNTSVVPWYFMYKEAQNTEGLVYDPGAKKWRPFTLPFSSNKMWFVASSHGLACFADSSNGYVLYVCNLLTRKWRKVKEPYAKWSNDYHSVALMLDKNTNEQIIVVASSSQVADDYSCWMLRIEVFGSAVGEWRSIAQTVLNGWRGGDNSVICNGVFYCVIHSTAMVGVRDDECRHGLLSCDLSNGSIDIDFVQMPCSLTCVKLINCNERLIMVGGIGRSDVVRGIGLWELVGVTWKKVSRMPNKFFRGFGEFDDVFSSSGTGGLIYIHAFGSPQLLLFDVRHHSWRWSQKCPMVKKHPLHLFMGFCFEPKLDTCP